MATSFGYYSLTNLNLMGSCSGTGASSSVQGTEPVEVTYDTIGDTYVVSLYESAPNVIGFAQWGKSIDVIDITASSGTFVHIDTASMSGGVGHFNTLEVTSITGATAHFDVLTGSTGSFTSLAVNCLTGGCAYIDYLTFNTATGTDLQLYNLTTSQAIVNGTVAAQQVDATTGAFDVIYVGPGGLTGPGWIPPSPFDTSIIHCGYLYATGAVVGNTMSVTGAFNYLDSSIQVDQTSTSITFKDTAYTTGAHTINKALGGPYNTMSTIEPYTDGTYSLGSPASRWVNTWSQGAHNSIFYLKQDTYPSTSHRLNLYDPFLGDSGGFYIRSPTDGVMTISTTAIVQPIIQLTTGTIQHHGNIQPDSNVTWSLGTSSLRYNEVWCNTMHVANNTIMFEGSLSTGPATITSEYIDIPVNNLDGSLLTTLKGFNITSDFVSATGVFTDFTTSYLNTTVLQSAQVVSTSQLKGNLSASGFIAGSLGAGSGYTISSTGSQLAGLITLDTGTGCATGATIAQGVYTYPMTGGSFVQLTPYNRAAAILVGDSAVWVTSSDLAFSIKSGNTPLVDSTQYKWAYSVLG